MKRKRQAKLYKLRQKRDSVGLTPKQMSQLLANGKVELAADDNVIRSRQRRDNDNADDDDDDGDDDDEKDEDDDDDNGLEDDENEAASCRSDALPVELHPRPLMVSVRPRCVLASDGDNCI